MRRLVTVSLLIVWSAISSIALAAAQEYAQETGDLELTKSIVLTISGDGFVGDSVVFLALTLDGTDEVIDLGTLDTDPTGAFSGSITLPDDLAPGTYTISATGVTEDGATRVLSATISINGDVTTASTTTTTAAETTTTTTSPTTTTTETEELPESATKALLAGLEAVRGAAAE